MVTETIARYGCPSTAMCYTSFQPIPGFARADCVPVASDSVSAAIRRRGRPDLSSLRGRAVRFRIYLNNADLYSLQLD